ncbi:MAG: alpha/beta hydrolase [Burkholderiales bacterium]|nr:alpha/beta hydrolase [Burkholderiales bacterium]
MSVRRIGHAGAQRSIQCWRVALILLAGVLGLFAGASLLLGEALTRPALRSVGPPPADLATQPVRIAHADGGFIAGWLLPGRTGAGAVLLLHSIGADRRQMLGRARFLRREGYAALLIDLQAHGESSGKRMSFGHREARDVAAALDFLAAASPGERLGVIGVSLGGAAAAFARPRTPPAAMVLEAVYPDIGTALGNRLRLRMGSHFIAEALIALLRPLLLAQGPLWIGASADLLNPAAALAANRIPLVLVNGERDRHTTVTDGARLLGAAGGPRALWLIPGAGHEDLHAYDPHGYEARVGDFLARHLRAP